jgi:hypothetical protein
MISLRIERLNSLQSTKECGMGVSENLAESGWQSSGAEQEQVSFSKLSEMTGFPVEFIKKELLLDTEPVSIKQLRASMLKYLESSSEMLKS